MLDIVLVGDPIAEGRSNNEQEQGGHCRCPRQNPKTCAFPHGMYLSPELGEIKEEDRMDGVTMRERPRSAAGSRGRNRNVARPSVAWPVGCSVWFGVRVRTAAWA